MGVSPLNLKNIWKTEVIEKAEKEEKTLSLAANYPTFDANSISSRMSTYINLPYEYLGRKNCN